jgi:hypothetical protein
VDGARELQHDIQESKRQLQSRRTALVGQTTTLLAIYHAAICLIIRILEQSKHGQVSRYVKAKAEYLSTTAKMVELEIKEKGARGQKTVYTEEVKEALGNYVRSLRDGRERLRERMGDA